MIRHLDAAGVELAVDMVVRPVGKWPLPLGEVAGLSDGDLVEVVWAGTGEALLERSGDLVAVAA